MSFIIKNYSTKDTLSEAEKLKVTDSSVIAKLKVYVGKDNGYWVYLAPAVAVSGYGSSKKKAQLMFEESLNLFCQDITKANATERAIELKRLGWQQEKLFKKRYTSHVDENGVLKNFDPEFKIEVLELSAAA
ncbi:hypothetical protein BH09BAC1_BH09BAC1_20590 [soil metagenome]